MRKQIMRWLIVGTFLVVYYSLLLLFMKYVFSDGFRMILLFLVGGLVFSVFLCVAVTYELYARLEVFSPVLLPAPSEYSEFALYGMFFHILEFSSVGRAILCFLQGKVVSGILCFLLGLGVLFVLYYAIKNSPRWTFLEALLKYDRAMHGCGLAEVAVALLPTTREYEEPTFTKCTVSLDGASNGAAATSVVIKSLGDSLWRKRAFIVLNCGSQYSYLVVRGLRSFFIRCGVIEIDDAKSGIEAMNNCCEFIHMHEYEMPKRDDKIGLWDFWVLLKLFSCFWEDDKDMNIAIDNTEEVIRNKIRKANDGVTSQIDNAHFLYLYLRGELCKRFYSS